MTLEATGLLRGEVELTQNTIGDQDKNDTQQITRDASHVFKASKGIEERK